MVEGGVAGNVHEKRSGGDATAEKFMEICWNATDQ